MKKEERITIEGVVAVAGELTRANPSGNWNIFSEECLRDIAEKEPERFRFEHGQLITTMTVDKKYLEDLEKNSISIGCKIKS